MKKLYQTLENRSNPDEIENYGPFKCRTATSWLGEGYYFWDGFIELAHFWGKNGAYSNYVICEADADLHDENCYDLVGNIEHLKDFRSIIALTEQEGLVDNGTTVRRILTFMKDRGLFKHSSVRASAINSINDVEDNKDFTLRVKFIEHKKSSAYLDVIPPIQICIFDCSKVALKNYKIVFPDYYVEGYAV